MNNPETYVLTHNRFSTSLVLIFNGLNKAQIYKMPYRDSPNYEIEIVLSFDYLNLFKPNEHLQDHHTRKPNDEIFLFEIEDKKYIFVGEKVISFETNDIIVKYSLHLGFDDIKFPYAYGEENIYLMLDRKYLPIQEYKTSTEKKNDYRFLYKKDDELEGDNITDENEGIIAYGIDFINCIVIHDRAST